LDCFLNGLLWFLGLAFHRLAYGTWGLGRVSWIFDIRGMVGSHRCSMDKQRFGWQGDTGGDTHGYRSRLRLTFGCLLLDLNLAARRFLFAYRRIPTLAGRFLFLLFLSKDCISSRRKTRWSSHAGVARSLPSFPVVVGFVPTPKEDQSPLLVRLQVRN